MEVDQAILDMIWSIQAGERPVNEPISVRAWMEFTVSHVISIMRDEDLLQVRNATVEWNSGSAVVTSNVLSSLPMGTLAYIADEWREEMGA